MKIWTVYVRIFFAPMFHALFPADKCYVKKKLKTVTSFFIYCRLAYPSFKPLLKQVLKNPELNLDMRSVLLNLKDLCEYFIPQVTIA